MHWRRRSFWPDGENNYEELLSAFAAARVSTDEEKGTGAVEGEQRVAVRQGLNRVGGVAGGVVVSRHDQHGVVSFRVLENCMQLIQR